MKFKNPVIRNTTGKSQQKLVCQADRKRPLLWLLKRGSRDRCDTIPRALQHQIHCQLTKWSHQSHLVSFRATRLTLLTALSAMTSHLYPGRAALLRTLPPSPLGVPTDPAHQERGTRSVGTVPMVPDLSAVLRAAMQASRPKAAILQFYFCTQLSNIKRE